MSQVARALLATLATYSLVHAGIHFSGFNPIRDLPKPLGWGVDVAVWMAVYAAVYWLLGSSVKPSGAADPG